MSLEQVPGFPNTSIRPDCNDIRGHMTFDRESRQTQGPQLLMHNFPFLPPRPYLPHHETCFFTGIRQLEDMPSAQNRNTIVMEIYWMGNSEGVIRFGAPTFLVRSGLRAPGFHACIS